MSLQDPPATRADADALEQQGTFRSGNEMLLRRSVEAQGAAWARVALVHGYGEHSGRHHAFMRFFAERGVACHAFDFRGHGLSTGQRGFVRAWDEFLEDLQAFLSLPELAGSGDGLFIVGHSHGGLVAAAAAERGLLNARGVVLSNPYLQSCVPVSWQKAIVARCANWLAPALLVKSGIEPEWLSSDPDMIRENREDKLGLRIATPRWWAQVQCAQAEVMASASSFRLPLLLLQGTADMISRTDGMNCFFERAGAPDKQLNRYEGMLHELLREAQRERVFVDILAWMRQRSEGPSTDQSFTPR